MGLIGRTAFVEILSSAALGTILFTFVLFLNRVTKLFEQLVRGSAPPETVLYLFALLLPPALTFTIPVGVLAGTLLAMSRMSGDTEIVALRASGIPGRRLLIPVLAIGLIGTLLTGAASLWLTPLSVRQTFRTLNRIAAAQLTAEIQPRVFEEQFPNTVLYVGDVIPGPVVRWRNLFLADISPAEKRAAAGGGERGNSPRVTIASEAMVTSDVENNRLQLSLVNGSTHEPGRDPAQYYKTAFPRMEQALAAAARGELRPTRVFVDMDTGPLWRAARNSTDAAIELHQRLALPFACILLGLVGVPMGVTTRKSGRSAALVITVGLAFLYYMGLLTLIGLARQGSLPPWLALWLPNAGLLLLGALMLFRLEYPSRRDLAAAVGGFIRDGWARLRGSFPAGGPDFGRSFPIGPQLIDHYVLTSFLFYFVLLLTSFVLMTQVFTFFELLGDILRNKIAMTTVGRYLLFLTPTLIYQSTPVSVLVAVLVTFGVLTKNNEVTAFKACGISLYRLAVPVLLAGVGLSAFLFAFDHYIVPDANRVQDGLRAQIKGRPVQTYLNPDRKWIVGEGSRIYYYRYFDAAEAVMLDVNVYELDPKTFVLTRHIAAERARWEPGLKTWIFQNGWAREFKSGGELFKAFPAQPASFSHLTEPPNYFLRELKQDKQMNFRELAVYIRDLQQSGFDTVRLQVQYHKKFAVPLFAAIMALVSVPFAFLSAHRGAMAGIGVSFGIAIAYWAVSQLFEQVGNVNQLPAVLAAWAPGAVFSLAGLYFLARVRT